MAFFDWTDYFRIKISEIDAQQLQHYFKAGKTVITIEVMEFLGDWLNKQFYIFNTN